MNWRKLGTIKDWKNMAFHRVRCLEVFLSARVLAVIVILTMIPDLDLMKSDPG